MIKDFEEYTHDLTQDELKNVVPLVVRGLELKIGRKKAITNRQMRIALREKYGIIVADPRMRKIIAHIRFTGKVMFLAAGKGYWVEPDMKAFQEYVNSLFDRGQSIVNMSEALEGQIRIKKGELL